MMTTRTECAMKQEFLNSWNLGIPMVMMVTSCACSLPKILPNKILSTRAPYLYINVTHVSNSEEPSRVHYTK